MMGSIVASARECADMIARRGGMPVIIWPVATYVGMSRAGYDTPLNGDAIAGKFAMKAAGPSIWARVRA